MPPDNTLLPLEQQVVRLQALLEASRLVHSTIDLGSVLRQAARIAVLELEMEGAMFTSPPVWFGRMPPQEQERDRGGSPRFPLLTRAGAVFSELVVAPPEARELSLYETDFLEGLALQTSIAAENAANHQRHLEYARVAQDLAAARAIQQSLLPQVMPQIAGYSLAARSSACYEVGGDYLDVVEEPGGSHLMVVADVAGKGLASALVCTAFRSAFRALSTQALPLEELAERLSQQHWDEGAEARRRYVTAIFVRLDAARGELEFVNAGHNPAILLFDRPRREASGPAQAPDPLAPSAEALSEARSVEASGTPLGMLPGTRYTVERAGFPPGARLLLYTDGLSEVFLDEEEFGFERLVEAFRETAGMRAEPTLAGIWHRLESFTGHAPQQDDMTAIALHRLTSTSEERA